MSKSRLYWKMAGVTVACPIVTWGAWELFVPKEGEVFKKFSPELQKKNLELRDERQKQYQEYLDQLKEYSQSEKPIWIVAREQAEKKRRENAEKDVKSKIEAERLKAEIRAEARKPV